MPPQRTSLCVRSFDAIRYALTIVLITSILLIFYGLAWEYSTRQYLHGFADAVVPYSASPEQKVEAILAWMKQGPARNTATPNIEEAARNPEDTLNYAGLLQVCGTATNAFVNLADSTGLQTRRLLLLGDDGRANHEVAEVLFGDRWVVVDPAFRTILRSDAGSPLTRSDLANAAVFEKATRGIPEYKPEYNYQRTTHVRLAAIPVFGGILESSTASLFPHWDETMTWTLLTERQSYALTAAGVLLLGVCLCAQQIVAVLGSKYFGIARVPMREQLARGSRLLGRGIAPGGRPEISSQSV